MGAQIKAPSHKFELPLLNFDFGNLTDGTDIPPPVQPSMQPAVTSLPGEDSVESVNLSTRQLPARGIMASPTTPRRQGSMRRLFSLTRLHEEFVETSPDARDDRPSRPQSQGGMGPTSSPRLRRTNSFLKALGAERMSASKRRGSIFFGLASQTPVRPVDPPPVIPEMAPFEAEVQFDEDMFRNIK